MVVLYTSSATFPLAAMSDRRLKAFYTVARLSSFTKAAKVLHLTQPAVTFQVRQLDQDRF